MTTVREANAVCRLLADGSRVRLLALLGREALTVTELTEVTGMTQSRVSTHLGKLRQAGLVRLTKQGAASVYTGAHAENCGPAKAVWSSLEAALDDPLLEEDLARVEAVRAMRRSGRTWADSVAGQMARHYSPGRTWETYVRGLLGLTDLGDVVDIASGDGALAELLASRARSVTCVDRSEPVIHAGRARLGAQANVRFVEGDMHALPLHDTCFDHALVMNALTYAEDPPRAMQEAARVLKPGGRLVASTLARHSFADAVAPYDHIHLGFELETVRTMATAAGLAVNLLEITHEERRAPHFRVVTLHATKETL